MAKYYGMIGFTTTDETAPGVWEEVITERPYRGDVNRFSKRWQNSAKVNDDIEITNEISILSDIFATDNLGNMRYVTWMGSKWLIKTIDVNYPRINLTLGGLYNGNEVTVEPADDSGDSSDE